MLGTILSLFYELGTLYIVLMLYLLFFEVSIEMTRKREGIIIGYATVIIFLCLTFSIPGDVLYAMVLTSLIFSKRKIRDTLMIIPAVVFYTMLSALSGVILEEIFWTEGTELVAGAVPFSYLIVDGMLIILIAILCHIVQKKKLNMTLRGGEIFSIMCYFFFGMFVWLFVKLVNMHWVGSLKILLGVVGAFFYYAVFLVYIRHLIVVRKSAAMNEQIKTEENYVQTLLVYLEKYKEENEDIKELRHDLRNHLQVMQKLYEKRENNELEKYIADLVGKTETIKELRITGNQAADIVISGQKERAEKADIVFTCKGEFDALDKMQAVDVCTLLSNLLDNAYEASLQVNEPFISIKGVKNRNYFVIEISNRTSSQVKINKGRAETTKKSDNHGNGMGIVNRLVEKYQGECIFQCEEKIFSCKIMFPLEK